MADKPVTVAAFAGSLRKDSYNHKLLDAAVKLAPQGMRIDIMDISDVPLYNQDLEDDALPEAVTRVRDTIRGADALLIVTPEHNFAMSAVTKNIIEWASRPPEDSCLDGKPAAVMGASPGAGGTRYAQAQVRLSAVETGMFVLQDPQVRVADADEKFNVAGELMDEHTKRHVADLLKALVPWIRRFQT